jgi:hypothetical protein
LPDGLFSNQKNQFWSILGDLRLVNVDIFYGHLEYCTDVWDILWPFATFCVALGTLFWYHAPRKIWQPCSPATLGQSSKMEFPAAGPKFVQKG